jgi:hypothetical protein
VTIVLRPGLYEQLVTRELEDVLRAVDQTRLAIERAQLDPADAQVALARHLHQVLERVLRALPEHERLNQQLLLCNAILDRLREVAPPAVSPEPFELVASPPAELRAVHQITAQPVGTAGRVPRPIVPLSASDLLVNARGEPGVAHALQHEIPSADSIDVLCAFVRWNGLRLLESALQAHCERGRPLRVLTTTYIGATERRALDRLERADGQSVLEWFDGRIAAELRLWDALERGLLCPFHYRNFRFDQRFRAITGGTRASLTRDIEEGFPRLPAGCVIRLDFFREAKVAAG